MTSIKNGDVNNPSVLQILMSDLLTFTIVI
jgi:hypothetical protein